MGITSIHNSVLPFGFGALTFITLYLLSLIVIGWLGYRARQENTLKDFYLAGNGFGFFVLVLTLYATQYSGNTLFGFTGKTYRIGFAWIMSLQFMTAIIVFYLLFAPRLYALSKKHTFVTPTDFLNNRYNSKAVNVIATIVMMYALCNYLLAQLMAMGRALQGLTTIDQEKAYIFGVIILALIIVIYETLGGLRAVAWTDMIQGLVLIIGFGVLLILVFNRFGSLQETTNMLAESSAAIKLMPPNLARCREWFSYILLVGLGGALYPQALQRIYAARSEKVLRRSLQVMALLPLTTTIIAVIVGITALAHFPGLTGAQTDKVLTLICSDILRSSLLGYWLVAIIFAAILAAIMSTADSALLSISSMIVKDIYAPFFNLNAAENKLTKIGKQCSWILMIVLVIGAILLKDATLIKLLDRKFDLLVQLVPAFMLGVHWKKLHAQAVLWGMLCGIIIALTLAFSGFGKIMGIHAGIYGLICNMTISILFSIYPAKKYT